MAAMSVPQALQLLQLEPGATRKQIRTAYKCLALQLHPDKQHQHPQQQQSTAAFARLAAAYSLLLQGYRHHAQQQRQQDQADLQPFETAYATGSLFSEQLVDEAARCQADPADIWNLQLLAAAAAEGQLAQRLAANPPSAADEQLWKQLHTRMQLRQQARQKQQQQQAQGPQQQVGVGVAELLTDLLLRPTGPLFVEEDSEEGDTGSEEWNSNKVCLQQQQPLLHAGTAGDAQQQGKQQDGARSAPARAPQQHQQQVQLHTHSRQQQDQQQEKQQGGKLPRQLRHGWGFYWMWLRRALLAKALLSVVSSGLKAKLYEHRFPEPLPLPRG